MSTKNTLAHGPRFHLYREAFDDQNIYLEVEGTHFEASYNRVMLPIPVHVWEVIRRYQGADFDFADMTDEALNEFVESQVDVRIKQHEEAGPRGKTVAGLWGSLSFGSIEQTRQEQIATGLAHFVKIRSHQQQVRQAIADVEQLLRRNEGE